MMAFEVYCNTYVRSSVERVTEQTEKGKGNFFIFYNTKVALSLLLCFSL